MFVYRVLIVDDSTTIRAMLEEVLGREPGFALVGAAGDAIEATRLVQEFRPHVTTLDIAMPGIDGLSLLDSIHLLTHAVMVSGHTESARDAIGRGAFGFFDKAQILKNPKRLVKMVRDAAEGKHSRYREARVVGEADQSPNR